MPERSAASSHSANSSSSRPSKLRARPPIRKVKRTSSPNSTMSLRSAGQAVQAATLAGSVNKRASTAMRNAQNRGRRDRHGDQRALPHRGEDRLRRDVDRLPRLRSHPGAVGGDQADAPRHLQRSRPAGALPPRGAHRGPPQPPPRGDGDRRRRGRGQPVHRLRVRRGRDAQGPDQALRPPAGGRSGGLRHRDRPGAVRSARPAARAPRRQAPERPDRRGGPRQGHRLRHRPLDRGARPDRHRPGARHHRLRLARAGAGPPGRRAVRPLLARDRALRDADRRGPLPGGHPGRGGDEARAGADARRPAPPAAGVLRAGQGARPRHRQGDRQPLRHRRRDGPRPRGGALDRGRPRGRDLRRGDHRAPEPQGRHRGLRPRSPASSAAGASC